MTDTSDFHTRVEHAVTVMWAKSHHCARVLTSNRVSADDKEEAKQKCNATKAALLALVEEAVKDREKLRKVAKSAATGILLAIATEDGLDGQEGTDLLAALAEVGIKPYPLHEEGCMYVNVGTPDEHIECVESCQYVAARTQHEDAETPTK